MLVKVALFTLAFGVLYLLAGAKTETGAYRFTLAFVLLLIMLTLATLLGVDTEAIPIIG